MNRLTLAEINALDASEFAGKFGSIYEHSPWVAERAFEKRPFGGLRALAQAMANAVAAASDAEKLVLLRAHPDLAGKAALAKTLTAASNAEQASAGLDTLTPEEMEQFQSANARYAERFGFPFILAVKYWGKAHILASYRHRLGNSPEQEVRTALAEIDKIAFVRLADLVEPAPTGRLTTHVLDTARGCPAQGVRIDLVRLDPVAGRVVLKSAATNADGRLDAPALAGSEMHIGRYELVFSAGAYFLATGQTLTAPAFLDQVPIGFAIADPEAHYHVPLLLSPWAYSTYRGS
jgi:2-oxo-4-hydroxy-4-carboxy-5-ureidoimidazoline decarboxylase